MNVVTLKHNSECHSGRFLSRLLSVFSDVRRDQLDPYWLKENAELLQILAATGLGRDLLPEIRTCYASFVDKMCESIGFFPQYYRLYLSIALDLRDLGVEGVPVDALARYIISNNLPVGELADLHRSEVRLLLKRAGVDYASDPDLDRRLMHFARNSHTFCLPNRYAAYSLTHIVFHNTDYGRCSVVRDPDLRLSLVYAGMVAWLEDNRDLLAEIVLALHLMGEESPQEWRASVCGDAETLSFSNGGSEATPLNDDYHQYFVTNWAAAALGKKAFVSVPLPDNARLLHMTPADNVGLRALSVSLMQMGDARLPDWGPMRWRMWQKLCTQSRARLEMLESMPEFESFFMKFARAARAV